jgi:hypothetical protein
LKDNEYDQTKNDPPGNEPVIYSFRHAAKEKKNLAIRLNIRNLDCENCPGVRKRVVKKKK